MRSSIAICIVLVASMILVGWAGAAQPPKATFSNPGIKSTDTVSLVKGSISTSQTIVMKVAENEEGVDTPLDEVGDKQSTNTYTEMTDAKNGQNLEYSKVVTADPSNKVLGTYNIQAHRSMVFEADPTKDGRMTSSEKLVMDVAGAQGISGEEFLCPFAAAKSEVCPPFCNIASAGSSLDVTYANVVTDAGARDIQAVADFPVELTYAVSGKGVLLETPAGLVLQPMTGSISASMNVHTQEARAGDAVSEGDFVYTESTSASGFINSFAKTMLYQDGALRI
jgi:hypothetical protein